MENKMNTIRQRRSVRNYSSMPIEKRKLTEIEGYLNQEFQGPFGYKPWFRLLNLSESDEKNKGTLGAYGFIRGAKVFIAGATENTDLAVSDYGYCLEKIILETTKMGLGTCWLAGSFKKTVVNKYFTDEFGMKDSEFVPAITPLGYSAGKPTFIDTAARAVLKTNQRKPWSELFFMDGNGEALSRQSAEKYSEALEAVRLAPSASNGQPWRIFKDSGSDNFHFYLKGGYMLDMGIAMAHFELMTAENGLSGKWARLENRNEHPGMKYAASWVANAA